MVNVTHYRNDWWTINGLVAHFTLHALCARSGFFLLKLYIKAKLFNDNSRRLEVDALVDSCGDAVLEKLANQRGYRKI